MDCKSRYDWIYHGVGRDVSADGRTHLMAERAEVGPSERQHAVVLRELPDDDFYWGYGGDGPNRAAAAILADALGLGDPYDCGLGLAGQTQDATFSALRVDFCCDVLRHLCEEWRLSRGTVLRWVRGWYAEHGITALPQAVAQLPPIDTFDG